MGRICKIVKLFNCSIVVLIIFVFFLNQVVIYAQEKILINEFLIESTPQAVEIINTGLENLDISNWYIDDNGGSTYFTIPQNTIIYSNSCLVFSSNFYLNKSSPDSIRLFDNTAPPTSTEGKLIDSFSYNLGPASGLSYLRLPDGTSNWNTGQATLGKFNSTGQSCLVVPTAPLTPTNSPAPTVSEPTDNQPPVETLTSNPTSTETPNQTPTPPLISYDNIFLSEAMVYPQTGENEWIEIYNNNDFPVSLNNWYIDDVENGGSSIKSFSITISQKGYGVFELTSSMFNNNSDSVRLLDFNKNLNDSFEYSTVSQGKTYARISFDSDKFCLQEPSKGFINGDCIDSSITPDQTQKTTPTNTLTPNLTPSIPIKISSQIKIRSDSQKPYSLSFIKDTPAETDLKTGKILGTVSNKIGNYTSDLITPTNYLLIQILSFVSFSYSVLTISAILLKMK